MIDRDDDLPSLPEEHDDPVLELIRAHRPEAPADIAERVLAEVTGPVGERRRFWREAEVAAGRALLASAAAALLTTGLAFWSAAQDAPSAGSAVARRAAPAEPAPESAPEQAPEQAPEHGPSAASPAANEPLSGGEELALAGPDAALTLQGYWLLGEGE